MTPHARSSAGAFPCASAFPAARFPLPLPALITLVLLIPLLITPSAADAAPALSLNGRPVAVLTPDTLTTFADPGPPPALPLSSLFPPLDSVDRLEVHSPSGPVLQWESESPSMGIERWNSAELVMNNGSWELRTGPEILRSPEIIAVEGTLTPLPVIRIWSAVHGSPLEEHLKSLFILRGIPFTWRHVKRPAHLLEDPPDNGPPHLILLNDLDLIRSLSWVTSYRRLSGSSSRWIARDAPETPQGAFGEPAALDARSPEAAAGFLIAENPDLFGGETPILPRLARLLQFAANRPEGVIITEDPLEALSSGRASSALLPAGASASPAAPAASGRPLPPPEGAVNILRLTYAAVPAALNAEERSIANRLLADTARLASPLPPGDTLPLPLHPRTLKFFEAYQRIGRLVLSGQLDAFEAAELIRASVETEQPPRPDQPQP